MHNSSDNEKPNPMILISNGLVIEKQVKKKQCGQERTTFRYHIDSYHQIF